MIYKHKNEGFYTISCVVMNKNDARWLCITISSLLVKDKQEPERIHSFQVVVLTPQAALKAHVLGFVTFFLNYHLYRVAQLLSKPPSPSAPLLLPPVSKCSPLKRWCPICHMWAKRDHALLFSITEFSSCQLRWDRRRSRWVAVSTINQHEIFSFEYTHHLLILLLLSLLETPWKIVGVLV